MTAFYQYVAPAMVLVFSVALPGWALLMLADAVSRWPMSPVKWKELKRDAKVNAVLVLLMLALCLVGAGC